MEAWSSDTDQPFTVDKSRFWLHLIETLRALYPDFKMIVCLRDLRDIYKSIEMQHRKTLMLAFPGRLEQNLVEARATQLFASTGVIGGPLKALYNLNDIPDVRAHLYFWRFESFVKNPVGTTQELLRWMGAEPASIPLDKIVQTTHESDSHYHFKFTHRVSASISPPGKFSEADLLFRILRDIVAKNIWYYRQFYAADGQVRLERNGPSLRTRTRAEKAPGQDSGGLISTWRRCSASRARSPEISNSGRGARVRQAPLPGGAAARMPQCGGILRSASRTRRVRSTLRGAPCVLYLRLH